MGRRAPGRLFERLSAGERFDLGLEFADRMVEAYFATQGEGLALQPGEAADAETRRRRFQALRQAEE